METLRVTKRVSRSTVCNKRGIRRMSSFSFPTMFVYTIMRLVAAPFITVSWMLLHLRSVAASNDPIPPTGGCKNPAIVSTAVGSTSDPETGRHVLDSNLRTKWIAFGEGQSLWLELAAPTVVDSVAIAFRKGTTRVHSFSIYFVYPGNQTDLAYKGDSSGLTEDFQVFALGSEAKKIAAVTIVGNGNDKNKWNGYSEVQVCESEEPTKEVPFIEGVIVDSTNEVSVDMELSFPEGRKGFNVVNMCTFPIRVGSTGGQTACGEGTTMNPYNENCFWALPEGKRDLAPRETAQYILPELGLKAGSIIWSGIIWASTGCTSELSDDYDHPSTENCVTNFCPGGGVCPGYRGASGVTTKAEFTIHEGGLDFYDVSVIDGANIPIDIKPIDPVSSANAYYCGTPGSTEVSAVLGACTWSFAPDAVEGFPDTDLSPYTRVVWPSDLNNLRSCQSDSECQDSWLGDEACGIYEERRNGSSSLSGSLVPNVCGRTVGWAGAHTACGSTVREGDTFPNDFPYYCGNLTRHGTFEQVYRCTGDVYGSQPCYLTNAEDSCCGCPSWDEDNGGCVSSNPDWTASSYPWAKFFKSACPTAYSFPRDDRTSIFACSDAQLEADASENVDTNAQSCEIGAPLDLKVTTTLCDYILPRRLGEAFLLINSGENVEV